MKKELLAWWQARAPRERMMLALAAGLLGVAFFAWFLLAAEHAREQLRPELTALRGQAARLERDALEIQRLRAAPPPATSHTDLRTLLETQARAAGLGGALTQIDVQDADHAQATFGAVPFAAWLQWVSALQAQHVRLASSRIEGLSTPGMVSVSATFARAGAR